jgi:hypothetical protein
MIRRGKSHQNKAKQQMRVQRVEVISVLEPYKADNILNFTIRYQSAAGSRHNILRSYLLNTLLINFGSATVNFRLCAAVRINKVKITTSGRASLEWLSAYGPTSATVITATSATTPGFLVQKPPKNSLAGAWSLTGSNETEAVMQPGLVTGDFIDVFFSVVLLDIETGTQVNTTGSGTTGQIYRSYLDGPVSGADLVPIYSLALN